MDTPKQIGRYQILEELGRGAMGTVYRAKDPAMDREVALKTIIAMALASQQGEEFRERFYREARAAGALAHPGIVAVFDVGEHESMPFLVMEFIRGRTLADSLKRGERLTLDRVCEIGQKIAEALGYAHQRGVVHRDIKPANILLTSLESHGIERPKITDFGVAKLAEGQTTLTGQILGTPAFMPPEQFTGAPIDGRADIFSLGVVLYQMATGEQPFPGESMTAVSYKVVHTDPVPPRKLNPSLPPKLESVILKCLAKSPEERYQTGEDLARELGQIRMQSNAGRPPISEQKAEAAENDPNATLMDLKPMEVAKPAAVPPPPASPVAAVKQRSRTPLLAVAAVALVVTGGGWYVLRHRGGSAAQPEVAAPSASAPSAAAASAPPASTLPSATKTTAPSETPTQKAPSSPAPPAAATAAKKLEAKAQPSEEKTPAAPEASAAAPEPAPLGFNPQMLDAKQNARLRIDAEHMPTGMDFTVEMNGRLYFQRASGDSNATKELFVPPGVQEFRVVAKQSGVERISNTVSTEFKAKKRNTLKIELRSEGMSADAVPQGLYPNTHLVLTLK